MKRPEGWNLLGGYATGTLTKSEREILMRAVLEDPDLFEQFTQEEQWRAAMADAGFRQRLLRRLRELQQGAGVSWRQRFAVVFNLRWLAPASAIAILTLTFLIRQGIVPESSPLAGIALAPARVPAIHAAGILEQPGVAERRLEEDSRSEPPPKADSAALGLDRGGAVPTYHPGDRQRIGFRVPADANVLLMEVREDGSSARLFPNKYQSSSSVKANETILVPPAGQGDLTVEDPPGARTLRLLIFPSGVDPLGSDVVWADVRGQARVIEKKYEVRP